MPINDPKNDNIIDLAKERKKQRTLSKQKKATDQKRAGASGSDRTPGSLDWKSYLQFAAFIALFAYILQTCGR